MPERIIPLEAVVIALCCAGCGLSEPRSHVNFAHMEHLTEMIEMQGQRVGIVHIYANYPGYSWVDAKESGPEGIACVDDAARAAVTYLRDYELNKRAASLERSRRLLDFVMAMQAPDGEFWNFIFADHAINRDGKTSFKSFGWWAARGVWALGMGARVFSSIDPGYAARLGQAFERTTMHVDRLVQHHGSTILEAGYATPTWLLYGSGADASSELMLGLIEYYQIVPSHRLRESIRKLADGLMMMQDGDISRAPYGVHRSWGSLWHMWGNSQTMALAYAGRVLGDSSMIRSACREADGFYTRLLAGGFLKERDLAKPGTGREFEQIAYGVRPMAVGLLRLYDATGDARYLRMAGLAASWLFGNNVASMPMYDPASGRCYDGILSATEINRNSGAESTIEALMTLVELGKYPEAITYSSFRKTEGDSLKAIFVGPDNARITLSIDAEKGRFSLQ